MQRVQILGNFSGYLHEQRSGDVTLTQEHNHHINEDPVVLQNHVVIDESFLVLWVNEMVDCKPDQNATYEELDVPYKTLSWGSLDAIDVWLPVHFNVP